MKKQFKSVEPPQHYKKFKQEIMDDFFDSSVDEDQPLFNMPNRLEEPRIMQPPKKHFSNDFQLTQEQKINLCRRLPKGFTLLKKAQVPKFKRQLPVMSQTVIINYTPQSKEKGSHQEWHPLTEAIKQHAGSITKNRGILSVEGKTRQMQKIKSIIQRFRKHTKYGPLSNYMTRIGLLQAINEVQLENRKNLLNIDTFKERYKFILELAKNTATQAQTTELFEQMIEQFICYVEQARKTQFENNIQLIQKSVDKITRYISEVKVQGNWYVKKRKRGDKTYGQADILYLSDLIRNLPTGYLVGIWQIIQEKPFVESHSEKLTFNLNEVGNKKLREIELYVKSKLTSLLRSHRRKAEKIQQKRQRKRKQKQQNEVQKEGEIQVKQEQNPMDQIDEILAVVSDIQPKFEENLQKKEGQQKKEEQEEQDIEQSPVENENSSDSSMITDEEESQF